MVASMMDLISPRLDGIDLGSKGWMDGVCAQVTLVSFCLFASFPPSYLPSNLLKCPLISLSTSIGEVACLLLVHETGGLMHRLVSVGSGAVDLVDSNG